MSKQAVTPARTEIENLYDTTHKTITSLAKHYNTSNPTVRKWLISYDIKRRTQKEAMATLPKSVIPNKDSLIGDYNKMSIHNLATLYSVGQSTIYDWFDIHDIQLKDFKDACRDGKNRTYIDIQFSKELIESVYKENPIYGIAAKKLDISVSHFRTLKLRYNIPTIIPWRSLAEIDLFDYCKSLCDSFEHSNRSIINPFEIDIISHKHKLGIEYCGLYWHSETGAGKSRYYHAKKTDMMLSKGYTLLTIFESDDMSKIKSIIRTKLGINNRIYARNTEAKEITTKAGNEFDNTHHLSGACGASIRFGLFHNEELVMTLSMGKSRYSTKYEYECIRMTSHSNHTVVGGASKLFSAFRTKYNPKSMITYADRRFGEGLTYTHCGFKREANSNPNYFYFKKNTTTLHSRVAFQKHKLKTKLDTFDQIMTEYENMVNNGWYRIWDCGNSKYIWNDKYMRRVS